MALVRVKPAWTGKKELPGEAKRRLLYVEDEDDNFLIASAQLAATFQVDRAATSQEAFSRLLSRHYDIILMDIQLAGSELNGIEITKIIKGLGPPDTCPSYAQGYESQAKLFNNVNLPIIFVTAYAARYDSAALRAVGGDECISKPVDFAGLSFAISRLLPSR